MFSLYLLRHAKSAWPDGVADHDRPLAARGRQAAPLIGRHLHAAGYRPDRVLVSTALRTRETIALVAGEADLPAPDFSRSIYGAGAQDLFALVHQTNDAVKSLMIVGHNPGMGDCAAVLIDPRSSDGDAVARLKVKYPTAALAVFQFDRPGWASVVPGSLRLSAFITPRMLGGVDED